MERDRLFWTCMEREVYFRSSECTDGGVFFALPGSKTHGHQYLKEAKERGAALAVIEEGYSGETYGLECVRVKNTLDELQAIAAQVVREFGLRIVAITGSCGKTTTKDFTAAMLSTKYDVIKSEGSRNSQIGLSTDIINMRKNGELYVFEMGMSHAGEIGKLVRIAPPEVAAITMIGRAHLEFFDSIEGIAHAKGEIFSSEKLQKGFVGESVAQYSFLAEGNEIVPFRHFEELDMFPQHYHDNASLALAIASHFGISRESALESLHSFQDPRRFALSEHEGIYWLSDAYNCIPEALKAACKNLPKKGKRKGALLGEMKELGTMSSAIHKEVAEDIVRDLDYLVCFGNDMKPVYETFLREGKQVLWFATRDEAADALHTCVRRGDLVLIKGAHSQKLWELIPCYS